jgi:hypothetical protein
MAAAAAPAAATLPGILPHLYTTPPPIIPGGRALVRHPTFGFDPITGQHVYIPEGTILSTEPPDPVPGTGPDPDPVLVIQPNLPLGLPGLEEYYRLIYPLLMKFFTDMTIGLETTGKDGTPFEMIAVGSFAKNLYDPTQTFNDFDFQIYQIQPNGKYLRKEYRAFAESITPEWEKEVHDLILGYIWGFITSINDSLGSVKEFKLITNDDDARSPPAPLKISIKYEVEHESPLIIKLVDFNYSKDNVWAYNKIGNDLLKDTYQGGVFHIYTIELRTGGFIRTLVPCAFYTEKKLLAAKYKGDEGATKKNEKDKMFWNYKCNEQIRRTEGTRGARGTKGKRRTTRRSTRISKSKKSRKNRKHSR